MNFNHASAYISTATTTQVKTGLGKLFKIIITETAAGTITVYDETSGTSDIIAVFKASIAEQEFDFGGVNFTNGLKIITAGASKLTVVYE